jgi:hypothetical protein
MISDTANETAGRNCDRCLKDVCELPFRLSVLGEAFQFCSWACVHAFSCNGIERHVERLLGYISDLEYMSAHYR